jgi:hypothetical protein
VRWTAEYIPLKDAVGDQVVVTALADLFHSRKVNVGSRSVQVLGSMSTDMLRYLSKDRYGSRFDLM